MNNTPTSNFSYEAKDELLPEYDFDYNQAKRNRFIPKNPQNLVTVTLDPDVAAVFKTAESVNHALRNLLSAIPKNEVTLLD